MDHKKILQEYNQILEAQQLIGHDYGVGPDISLPRIVVVGGQSAGKSSVLESIVGFEFLPRGSGIVTRRPAIVQLSPSSEVREVKMMLTDSTRNYKNTFSQAAEVRDAIRSATENHDGCSNNRVSSDPLVVKIEGPSFPCLTLIDLPGLTRNKIGGQPQSIVNDIRELVLDYIKDENTIILAVSPSNIDIANCEAVKIAKEVDPEYKRTIGVYTKLDDGFYDENANCLPESKDTAKKVILQDSSYCDSVPSQWIPVKCRRTDKAHTMGEQLKDEKDFFENKFFPSMNFECPYGIRHLANVLSDRLVNEIHKVWPKIEAAVTCLLKTKKQELEEWTKRVDENEWKTILDVAIDMYFEKLRQQLTGQDEHGSLDEQWAGAQIVQVYKGVFLEEMESMDPLRDFSNDCLRLLINNHRGRDDGHFLQHEVLKRVVRHNLPRILAICQECVHSACCQLKSAAVEIPVGAVSSEILTKWVHRTTVAVLEKSAEKCREFVKTLVEMEKRINTNHPHYPKVATYDDARKNIMMGGNKNMPMECSTFASGDAQNSSDQRRNLVARALREEDQHSSDEEKKSADDDLTQRLSELKKFPKIPRESIDEEVQIIRFLLARAFDDVIRIKVIDSVPKAIDHVLVEQFTSFELKHCVMKEVNKLMNEGGKLQQLMGITDDEKKKHSDCKEAVKKLEEVLHSFSNL